MMIDQNEMTAQERVYTAVEARGYRQDWTDAQFAARQVVKLYEELYEAWEGFQLPADDSEELLTLLEMSRMTSKIARDVFDQREAWEAEGWALAARHGVPLVNVAEVKKELADVVVVALTLAGELERMEPSGFDVVSAAVAKAEKDIERGVRLSKVQENRQIDWEPGTAVEHGLNVTERSLVTAVAQVQAGEVHDVATLWEGVENPSEIPAEVLDLVRFLAKTWDAVDRWVYQTVIPASPEARDTVFSYPVVQGSRNQMNLRQIGNQPYNIPAIKKGVAWMLAQLPEEEQAGTRGVARVDDLICVKDDYARATAETDAALQAYLTEPTGDSWTEYQVAKEAERDARDYLEILGHERRMAGKPVPVWRPAPVFERGSLQAEAVQGD